MIGRHSSLSSSAAAEIEKIVPTLLLLAQQGVQGQRELQQIAVVDVWHWDLLLYLVTGPRLWRIGAQETVVTQAFGQKESFPIKISLLSFPDKRTTYAVQSLDLTPANNFQGLASLRIQPKDLARKDGEMQYIYLQAQSKSFTKEEKVPVTYQNGFLFIQTDKAIYTPDQSVKIRVYSMDEELRPPRRRVTLTIMDPEKVKMDTVTQDDVTGVISFPEFKIPANPRYGLWTIEATYESDFVTSSAVKFEVKEYVIPRFFVTIEPERNFISQDTFKDFAVTVKAKYYYGKIVEKGKAFIRYGIIANGEKRMMPKTIEVLQIINGEAEFHFNSERSVPELQYSSLEELDGAYLYITATVEEEEGAQSEESENSNVKYILTPYRLTLIATPLFVKPTLPYHVKVLVKDTLDNPTAMIPLTLSGEFTNENGESTPIDNGEAMKQRTDIKGTSVFVINIPAGITALDFRIKTDDPNLQEQNQAEAEFKATSYKSLTESYLYIDWARDSSIFQAGSFLNVNIFPKSPYLHKLTHYSYLIISKGKILQYNTVERVPGSVSQYLNIQITSSMVPSFRLLVYYIVTGESTAELIADSIWVEVQENCLNSQKFQVQLSKPGGTFKPKENVTLNINAQAGSIVALSAVDVAIYDVTKKSQRPLERVLRKIEESDLGCGAGAGRNNVDVFQTAGLTFITNANIQAAQNSDWKCDALLRSKRTLEDDIKKEAGKFHNESVKKCCMDGGTHLINEKECKQGTERVQRLKASFPLCAKVFAKCCHLAKQLKEKLDMEHKALQLGRMYIKTVFNLDEPEIRSYFPESWLWEEHAITDRFGEKKLQISLPDSLTTWEVQGVGMSDKGICVADPLTLTVFKDLFLDVQLPYSVVRGEQVQIKVIVYNYQVNKVMGCVSVSVTKEVCLVSDSSSGGYGNRRGCHDEIHPLTPKIYTYNLLPLELGLHPVTFTLNPKKEIVIKTLRVVPEGIQEENSMGFTLDPQGIRGIMKRNEDVAFKIPMNIVPKSKINRILSINGNILGEVIDMIVSGNSIQTLVSLPKGSAETELMRVVPIFYVYHYLDSKNDWSLLGPNTFMIQIEMKKKLKDGVSSILAFRNGDHSYSLRRDSDPSTWLTAFALRTYGEIQQYVSLDHMSVCNSLIWLIEKCQSRDGSFQEKSSTNLVKLQGTIPREAAEKALYLTAYVIIAIQKSLHMCPLNQINNALELAIDYVSRQASSAQTMYTMAICAYALHISDSTLQSKHQTIAKIKGEALTKGISFPPVYRYWKDTLSKFDPATPSVETAMMVETTAYTLLAILKSGDYDYAKPVARWLKEQQRYGGGFFSTQDTVMALEALTEVGILEKKLNLNMDVTVSYRRSGQFKNYRLTERNPFTKPVEVPILEDLIISTRSAYGIATGNVRTVYNIISPPQENCRFDLKIQKKLPSEDQSIFSDDNSQALLLEACAKYKPKKNENVETGQVVMEITLVTGLIADEKYLNELINRVDQYVVDYSVEDGKVVLHFDWIGSDEYICATLLVRKMFKVALISPGIFKVYELRAPDQGCTAFYNPYADDNLVRVCTGDTCKCIEGECPKLKSKLDMTTTAEQRKNVACKGDVTYAYKVQIVQLDEDGDFLKYTAKILDIFNKGTALVKVNKQIRFIKKNTCSSFDMENGQQYLIMGKDGIQIRQEREFHYEYPLDSNSWIEWWPDDSCTSLQCNQFLGMLEEFTENILLEGCQ